ncbi:hypothetical protein HQ560_00895 [bacterium]|nr:hypothetical protein [bacterium]
MRNAVLWTLCLALPVLCTAAEEKPKKAAKKVDAETATILEVLEAKKVSFDFVETPVGDALSFIQGVLDVNLVVAPNVPRDLTLTLRVNNMTAGKALHWMLKLVDAEMEVREGAIFVTAVKDGERLIPKVAKGKKAVDPRLRGKHAKALGKARVRLGGGGEFEFTVYEDDLGPDVRGKLLEVLRLSIEKEFNKLTAEGKKGEPKKGEPKKAAPKKAAPKQAAPKKGEAKKGEVKKAAPKQVKGAL